MIDRVHVCQFAPDTLSDLHALSKGSSPAEEFVRGRSRMGQALLRITITAETKTTYAVFEDTLSGEFIVCENPNPVHLMPGDTFTIVGPVRLDVVRAPA